MEKNINIDEITSSSKSSDGSTNNRVFEVTTNVAFSPEEVEECLIALSPELEYSKSEIISLNGSSKKFRVIVS